jgi:putative phosphoribosyl transferase
MKSVVAMADKLTKKICATTTAPGNFMTADAFTDEAERTSSQPARHVQFADLATAGRNLAAHLDDYLGSEDTVVVAIARGGVPVALEVANRLGAPLDIILIRRLLAPRGPGSQICAVNVCGTLVVDPELSLTASVPKTPLEYFVADALQELALRERTCRRGRPALEVERKNVLLIDNGIHTGSTVLAAIRALRTLKPTRLVVAVPIAALSSQTAVEAAADELISLAWPEPFGHVGLWYANFNVPDEEQIRKILDQVQPHNDSKFSSV